MNAMNKKQRTIPPQLFVEFCETNKKLDYSDHESIIKTRIDYIEKQRKIIQKNISDLQTHVDSAEKSSAKDGCARTKGIDFKKRKIAEV